MECSLNLHRSVSFIQGLVIKNIYLTQNFKEGVIVPTRSPYCFAERIQFTCLIDQNSDSLGVVLEKNYFLEYSNANFEYSRIYLCSAPSFLAVFAAIFVHILLSHCLDQDNAVKQP